LGENRNPVVAEIDGAVFISNKLHTKILFVESKNRRNRSVSKAREQLESLFTKKVNLAKGFKGCVEGITDIPNKGAFISVRFPRKV
jgi:hypothetical protein